jgi:hypothetical protein
MFLLNLFPTYIIMPLLKPYISGMVWPASSLATTPACMPTLQVGQEVQVRQATEGQEAHVHPMHQQWLQQQEGVEGWEGCHPTFRLDWRQAILLSLPLGQQTRSCF